MLRSACVFLCVGCISFILVNAGQNTTRALNNVLLDPCGKTRRGSKYNMDTLIQRTNFFFVIVRQLQLPEIFKEREGLQTIYGNDVDCRGFDTPTQLRKSSKMKRTLLNMYNDLVVFTNVMSTIEEREVTWTKNGRLLPKDALDGKLRQYIKIKIYDLMCMISTIVNRPKKIHAIVKKNTRAFVLDTEPVCSLFQTIRVLEDFENYLESSTKLLRWMHCNKQARKSLSKISGNKSISVELNHLYN